MKKKWIIILAILVILACGYFLYNEVNKYKHASALPDNDQTRHPMETINDNNVIEPSFSEESVDLASEEFLSTLTETIDDPGKYLGKPTWSDEMDFPVNWPVGDDEFSSGYFNNGYYYMTSFGVEDGWRIASTDAISDGYIEIYFSTEICKTDDHYGIIFRVPELKEPIKGYLFGVTCGGKYSLRKWDSTLGENGTLSYATRWHSDNNINDGEYQNNVLGVLTNGNSIKLFINGKLVNEIEDSSIEGEHFGVFVGWEQTENFTILIDKASYWLKQ